MRVVTYWPLEEFWKAHPDAETPLKRWGDLTERSDWRNFGDVKEMFSAADFAGKCIVFDIGGNKYRLITFVHFQRLSPQGRFAEGRAYVRHVLTHKEYDRGHWKDECDCGD